MSPAKSILPFAIISFANVETPVMFKPPPSTLIPPALTSTPVLAVTIPSESIFVTSSYVSTPVTFKLPVTCAPVEVVSNRFVP